MVKNPITNWLRKVSINPLAFKVLSLSKRNTPIEWWIPVIHSKKREEVSNTDASKQKMKLSMSDSQILRKNWVENYHTLNLILFLLSFHSIQQLTDWYRVAGVGNLFDIKYKWGEKVWHSPSNLFDKNDFKLHPHIRSSDVKVNRTHTPSIHLTICLLNWKVMKRMHLKHVQVKRGKRELCT